MQINLFENSDKSKLIKNLLYLSSWIYYTQRPNYFSLLFFFFSFFVFRFSILLVFVSSRTINGREREPETLEIVRRARNGGGDGGRSDGGEQRVHVGGRRDGGLPARRLPRRPSRRRLQKWPICGSGQARLGTFLHCLARLGHSTIGTFSL